MTRRSDAGSAVSGASTPGGSAPDGLWITFEGGDGSGKSTQAALLQEWFESQGRTVVRTREPGGTDIGRRVREIVLHHRADAPDASERPGEGVDDWQDGRIIPGRVGTDLGPHAEALLFAADRAHHIAALVRPAIERGEIVIQDRYLDSSVAYQGAGHELDADEVRGLSLWATEGALPDLTVLLDLDAAAARARLDADDKPFDRMEAQRDDFHTRVREAYLALAAAEPERFFVLDATLPPEELHDAVRARVAGIVRRPG